MGNACAVPFSMDKNGLLMTKANVRASRKPIQEKVKRSAGASLTAPQVVDWSTADAAKWKYNEKKFNSYTYVQQPKLEDVQGPITEGLAKLQAEPHKYQGLKYQTNSVEWPEDMQKYSLVLRSGAGFNIKEVAAGQFVYVNSTYQMLAHQEEIDMSSKDDHTDGLISEYAGKKLAQPRHPGRGHGCVDVPHIKIIGDIHPNDVAQGTVGDCWLLSAISAMSEFDGAIKILFAKTPGIDDLPKHEFNKYVVTLHDLKTMQPVDIVIDERLCSTADGSRLLGCEPSVDAELWACYLEKAVAIHCGGWDELDGGHCTHAWRILTGCMHCYTFMNAEDAGFQCFGTKNPNTEEWEKLENSPHQGFQGLWPMEWPECGGGGEIMMTVDENEMFERMCAWDDQNYIIACGTKAGEDTADTDGIVDGHAYTVLTCINDAAGTKFDMVRVRNPWGKGEFKSGMWADEGPGWEQYPEVKEVCKPVNADDGVFWVEKGEFFKYFKTIYLCASDMGRFIEGQETF